MKPLTLTIKGLNSFCEEQTIDFSKLMEHGLFGIFGPTGSGKSTIIDAITKALFGFMPRYAKKEQEKVPFINTNASEMAVTFGFSIKDGTFDKVYEVTRHYKKSGTQSARLCEIVNGEKKPIAEKSTEVSDTIQNIIGLGYDDFLRSVILPQGKFSEFLMLTGKDRALALERLFNLQQYGALLTKKITDEFKTCSSQLEKIQAEVSALGDITDKTMEAKRLEYENTLLSIQQIDKDIQVHSLGLEKTKMLLADLTEWKQVNEKYSFLQTEEVVVLEKVASLKDAEKADKVFPFITQLKQTAQKNEFFHRTLEDLLTSYHKLKENLDLLTQNLSIAQKEKDEKLPFLLEKEANAKQAVKIQETLQQIENDRLELQKLYKTQTDFLEKITIQLSTVTLTMEKTKTTIMVAEEEKTKLSKPVAYKQLVEKAFNLERKLVELTEKMLLSTKKINTLTSTTSENKKLLQGIDLSIHTEELLVNTLSSQVENHLQNMPGDTNTLLTLQNGLNQKKLALEEAKKQVEKIAIDTIALEKTNQVIATLEADFKTMENHHTELLTNFEAVTAQKKATEQSNLASLLSEALQEGAPCPVCGSTNHPSPAEKIFSNITTSLEEKIETLSVSIKNTEKNMHQHLLEISTNKQNRENLQQALGEMKLLFSVDELTNQVCTLEKDFETLKQACQRWELEKTKLTETQKEKISQLHDLKTRKAVLLEAIAKDETLLSDYEKDVTQQTVEKNSVETTLETLKDELQLSDIEKEFEQLKQNEKRMDELENLSKVARAELEENNIRLESLIKNQNETALKRQDTITAGKEKKKYIDEQRKMIQDFCGAVSPFLLLNDLQKTKDELTTNYETLKAQTEEATKRLAEINQKKTETETQVNTFGALLKEQTDKLNEALAQYGFKSKELAVGKFLSPLAQQTLAEEIEKHYNETKTTKDNLQRLTKKIDGQTTTKLEVEALENICAELKSNYEAAIKKSAVLQEQIELLVQHIAKQKTLKKQEKSVEKRKGLLNELKNITAGNNFVTYISKSKLHYVTTESSKRLHEITNGHYSLVLSDEENESDFKIMDNFNGGVTRSVKTLSGGETFLVSLCLALSLSSRIQLKNQAPLEFFFLDEGFGTLDQELLDTVITSLERLKNEKLSIGLITHVEELKSRIPTKLIVKEPEQGVRGTSVYIDTN